MMSLLSFLISGLMAGLYGSYLIHSIPRRLIRKEQERINDFLASQNRVPSSLRGESPNKISDLIKKNESWVFSFLMILIAIWIPLQIGVTLHAFFILLFCWVLLLLACIDWKYQYLPDSLTLSFLWVGLLLQLQSGLGLAEIDSAIWGCVLGYLSLRTLNDLFFFIIRQNGLGHGDMKLFAMTGAWIGATPLPKIMLIACILFLVCSFIQYILKIKMRQQYFSFGPHIIAGTFSHLLFSI